MRIISKSFEVLARKVSQRQDHCFIENKYEFQALLISNVTDPPSTPLPPPPKKKETRKNCKANSHGMKIGKY